LSTREREVLRWVAAGRRQAEIAATLGLSAARWRTTCAMRASGWCGDHRAGGARCQSRGEIETDHGEALPAVWFACYTRHAHVRDCRSKR
jgi:hypothetical protein